MSSVAQYLAKQPKAVQPLLRKVRAAIRKALPKAEEVFSYGIVGYRVNERNVLYLAGWKNYVSLYPVRDLSPALHKAVARYRKNVATMRLPLGEPAPVALIGRIAKFRAKASPPR